MACSLSGYSWTTRQALCDPEIGLSRWWHHCSSSTSQYVSRGSCTACSLYPHLHLRLVVCCEKPYNGKHADDRSRKERRPCELLPSRQGRVAPPPPSSPQCACSPSPLPPSLWDESAYSGLSSRGRRFTPAVVESAHRRAFLNLHFRVSRAHFCGAGIAVSP